MKHKCQEGRSCCCSITALEPDDDCPLHGYPFPPRCEICGRYMKWPETNFSATSIAMATVGMVDEFGMPIPIHPEPRQVRAEDIWPDYMLNWKCKKHPKYKGKLKPRVECDDCWSIYYKKQEKK